MARAQYFVVKHQSGWHIKLNGTQYGPYKSQANAVRFAIDAAQKAGEIGHDAEVVVQGMDSKFHTEWAFGRDPYPVAEKV